MRSGINPTDAPQAGPTPEAAAPRPRLLFITPTYPDTQGNGLAMRAGMFLEALAQSHSVTLLALPLFGERTPSSDALLRRWCEHEVIVPAVPGAGFPAVLPRPFDGRPELERIFAARAGACKAALKGRHFDVVHAFRTYTASLAVSLAASMRRRGNPGLHLDIDDIESSTHAELARLYEINGKLEDAEIEAREARRYQAAEQRLLRRFHRLYVCSEEDAALIRTRAPGGVRVAPNAVRVPERPLTPLTSHPFTFLFVGTLSYYPNEDAVSFFCREVLPKLRSVAEEPFRIRIVGRGAPAALRPLARLPDVRLTGEVPDIGREYADADAVIVPVRAGGGMRIKVLEAFAYRRPVVSTSAGIAGIDAVPEEHCLIADTGGEFATQCLRLMRNPGLREQLTGKAYDLVTSRYSPESLRQAIGGGP